jgi:hypothetical protein
MWSRRFHCPKCGGGQGLRSRPRGYFERFLLPVVRLHPVRCGHCFRRFFRLASVILDEPVEQARAA